MAAKPKHHFKKAHHMPPRGAPMRAEEAANTAGDPPVAGPAPVPMTTAPMPAAAPMAGPAPGGVPGQSTGGSVSKVAPLNKRSMKMYAPKQVKRNA
jgi:hypothetical protein